MQYSMIEKGEPSRAPNLSGALRARLAEMVRPLQDAALTGSGLSVEETEQLAQAMTELAASAGRDAWNERLASVAGATSLAFKDLDLAEKAIKEARRVLADGIDGDELDPGSEVRSKISEGLAHCLRAQSTIGAARLARS